jgi:outer membrane murein-binding lipoprotein Lpp
MGCVRSLLLLTAGAAIGGALLIAHRVSEETGKNVVESFSDVPAETQKLFNDVRARAQEAYSRGREACQQKQAEMEQRLQDGSQL